MALPRLHGVALASIFFLALCDDAQLEKKRRHCMRAKKYTPARKPNDLNATLEPLMNGAYAELGPRVVSTDPWIVVFDTFMTEEEVSALENHLFFSGKTNFMPSPAGGGSSRHQARHSETAFCTGECDQHETLQNVRERAGKIVGVPPMNFDFSQALRYKEGMFYKAHHDNHPTFHYLPSGARIFTYFVYFSDEGMEGGATYFPQVDIRAQAKRGAAVLFVNGHDNNPMRTDIRTTHESEAVTKGEKRGMNMWLYQYEYRHYWQKGCTAIDLADELGKYGKGAHPTLPKLTFQNNLEKPCHLIEIRDREQNRYKGVIEPGQELTVESLEGAHFEVRDERQRGKLLRDYPVALTNAKQRVHIGKKPKAKEEL